VPRTKKEESYEALVRELETTRQATMFMRMYDHYMAHIKDLDYMPVIWAKVKDFEEYNKKHETDECFKEVVDALGNFYEGLGVIVREGFMDIRLVALMWGGMTRSYWENIVQPAVQGMRRHYSFPRALSETEYVCRELVKYMSEHPELKT